VGYPPSPHFDSKIFFLNRIDLNSDTSYLDTIFILNGLAAGDPIRYSFCMDYSLSGALATLTCALRDLAPYYYSIVFRRVNGQVYFVLNETVKRFWGLTCEFAEGFEELIFGEGVSSRWQSVYTRPDDW
jgi:hypothetical protein